MGKQVMKRKPKEEGVYLEVQLGAYVGFKCLRHMLLKSYGKKKGNPGASGSCIKKKEGKEEAEEEKDTFFFAFLWDGVYLFLSQGLQLFRLALPVVFHDHHGSVDFAHRQVCGC